MSKKFLARAFVCLCLLQAAEAYPQSLGGLDVFGVSPESAAELERCFGAESREIVAAYAARDPQRAHRLEESLAQRVRQAGGFEAVSVSVVHYLDPEPRSFLTFNILPGKVPSVQYLPAPEEEVPDPDGLLASWKKYDQTTRTIDPETLETKSCPAHHCTYGFAHPKLQPFLDLFARKVPLRREELVKVLQRDKDEQDRVAAAYLLAHLPSAREVAEILTARLRDPSSSVRNSVMRVLAYMADHGNAGLIPVEPILPFLSSQTGTDRNKAAAIVAGLASDERHRTLLIQRAGCDLVRLLEMKQPNQLEWAHSALVRLRGQDLGVANPAAWREWLRQAGAICRPEAEISPGKLCPLPPPTKPH